MSIDSNHKGGTTMETVASYWLDYALAALPEKAGRAQQEETRFAFYAGFTAALLAVDVSLRAGNAEFVEASFRSLQDECQQFALAVVALRPDRH